MSLLLMLKSCQASPLVACLLHFSLSLVFLYCSHGSKNRRQVSSRNVSDWLIILPKEKRKWMFEATDSETHFCYFCCLAVYFGVQQNVVGTTKRLIWLNKKYF